MQRFPVLPSRNRNSETLGSSLVSESVSESILGLCRTRNRSRNRNLDIPILGIGTGIEIPATDIIHTFFAVFTLKKGKKVLFVIEMVLSTGIGLEMQSKTLDQSQNRNPVLGSSVSKP